MQQQLTVPESKSVGRPTVVTDVTVAKLCEVLERGFSIQAACNWAQIDRATFYRHLRSDPIFATKVSSSVMFLYLAATEVIYKKIVYEKDPKLAMQYLERVDPERYGKTKLCKDCRNLQQQYRPKGIYYRAKSPEE
jgi:hypothetical protein